MAVARETDATLVKPLEGAVVRNYVAGSTIEAGMPVVMASDGAVDPGDADNSLWHAAGIALGPIDYVAGDIVPVVVLGPVQCVTGATPGGLGYVSDTAGEIHSAVGTKDGCLGFFESATVLFVRPWSIDLT